MRDCGSYTKYTKTPGARLKTPMDGTAFKKYFIKKIIGICLFQNGSQSNILIRMKKNIILRFWITLHNMQIRRIDFNWTVTFEMCYQPKRAYKEVFEITQTCYLQYYYVVLYSLEGWNDSCVAHRSLGRRVRNNSMSMLQKWL